MTLSLRAKLLVAGCLLTVVPLTVMLVTVYLQNRSITETTETISRTMADDQLRNVVQGVYALAESHQRVTEENLRHSLRVARYLVAQRGPASLGEVAVTWQARNQYTKEVRELTLPRLMLGELWLGQVPDATSRVPVVDEVRDLLGVTCTLFQRMNPQGDMLRVATNVLEEDGTRAIGTYIPRLNPDGSLNPVVAAVLKGQTFNGRAYVVNDWYITAYEPIFDEQHNTIGVLYVGVPQRYLKDLREAIIAIKLKQTGAAFVIDSSGSYVIAAELRQQGRPMDEVGGVERSLVEGLVQQGKRLDRGEVASVSYGWGRPKRPHEARLMYFEPWDWIIAAGAEQQELDAAAIQIAATGQRSNLLLLGVFLLALLAALLTWLRISRAIARPIEQTNAHLERTVRQLERRTNEIVLLNEMADRLQACASEEETYPIVIRYCQRLFPDDAGALCLLEPDHQQLRVIDSWGQRYQLRDEFRLERCWALRRGKAHLVDGPQSESPCAHLSQIPPHGYLCVPMAAQGEVLGMMFLALGAAREPGSDEERQRVLATREMALRSILEHYAPCLVNLRLRETLKQESICDPLTGLYNRRHMEVSLARELHRAQRSGSSIAVIMLDLDHFKTFNDTYGHDAGDELLRLLGVSLQRQARQEDIVCRYGGEEFLLILPTVAADKAPERAEEILGVLRRELHLEIAGQRRAVSASMGVALFPGHGRTMTELIRTADEALYEAKAGGRDRVVVARPRARTPSGLNVVVSE